jgi:oxygen-dependent protoporphyrinogen oxidase
MGTLPLALCAKLGTAYQGNTKVASLRRAEASGTFEIEAARDGVAETITANAVIVATPAYTAGTILRNISEQFSAILSRIVYAPVAVISAGYRLEQIGQTGEGFGFLIPRSEGLRVLGTVWNSSLFAGCAPKGMSLFTSFAGGATDTALFERTDEEIAEIVCAEVAKILRITGPPIAHLVQRYERALPQYNLGHLSTIASLRSLAESVPGLFFAGNYLDGPAIGACVDHATQTAGGVATRLMAFATA